MNRSETYDARWSKVGAPLAAQAVPGSVVHKQQYSLRKILGIWLGAVAPMVVLGWVAAALIGSSLDLGAGPQNNEAFTRAGLLTVGLIWQFLFAMALIFKDEGNLRCDNPRAVLASVAPRSQVR